MPRFRKIYLEISNICNLNCSFCHGTKRAPKLLSEEELDILLPKLKPFTDFLYFHLMGEPLLHPQLDLFLQKAHKYGFRVIITTNGTLLPKVSSLLLASPGLHKINISLHAFEANEPRISFQDYLKDCLTFAKNAEGNKLTVLRLWNNGGKDAMNTQILLEIERYFPKPWVVEPRGTRIGNRIYLEYGSKFDWPDSDTDAISDRAFCYALRDQIGILCDGTVVPCCLDSDGVLALGNLLTDDLEAILSSPRAVNIYRGFSCRTAVEPLCQRCGYVQRFQK